MDKKKSKIGMGMKRKMRKLWTTKRRKEKRNR